MSRIRWFLLGVMAVALVEPALSDLHVRSYQANHPWKEELTLGGLGDGWYRETLSSGEAYPPVFLSYGRNPDKRGVIHFATVSVHVYGENQLERAKAIGAILDQHPETWKADLPEYHR